MTAPSCCAARIRQYLICAYRSALPRGRHNTATHDAIRSLPLFLAFVAPVMACASELSFYSFASRAPSCHSSRFQHARTWLAPGAAAMNAIWSCGRTVNSRWAHRAAVGTLTAAGCYRAPVLCARITAVSSGPRDRPRQHDHKRRSHVATVKLTVRLPALLLLALLHDTAAERFASTAPRASAIQNAMFRPNCAP